MAYNYNYYPQQQQQPVYQARPSYIEQVQQSPQFMGLKGRPVASFDEAKASMIDFDGSVFYFPDAANKKIYTKQINLDGTSTINVYTMIEAPAAENVSRQEFNDTITALVQEIEKLKSPSVELNKF